MAHPYDLNQQSEAQHERRRHFVYRRPFHFIAALLLAAVVLVVTLSARNGKPPRQPNAGDYGSTPATAPR